MLCISGVEMGKRPIKMKKAVTTFVVTALNLKSPETGFEPVTNRLTVYCSTAELFRNGAISLLMSCFCCKRKIIKSQSNGENDSQESVDLFKIVAMEC